jgi:hypothetical protein
MQAAPASYQEQIPAVCELVGQSLLQLRSGIGLVVSLLLRGARVLDLDRHPLDPASELERHLVVLADRRSFFEADIGALVGGEDAALRSLDSALRDLCSVDEQPPGFAGAGLAAIIGEIITDRRLSRCNRLSPGNREALQSEKIVCVASRMISTLGAPVGAFTSKRGGGVALRASKVVIGGYVGCGIGRTVRSNPTASEVGLVCASEPDAESSKMTTAARILWFNPSLLDCG